MSKKNTGGPAFPSHGTMGEVVQQGMTLRDYFAAKAMQALLQRHGFVSDALTQKRFITTAAYEFADSMIEERER